MKKFIFFCLLFVSSVNYAQVISGPVKDAGRKMTGEPSFIIEGMKDGWAKYDLSVDINGKVTSVTMVETNLKSTPAKTMLRNHVKKYTFEPGTYYPKYHHVVVKVTMLKGDMGDPQIELD
ncbi:MAG: hypothetical protein CSA03_01390 [Bacteroidetes bacterium]|nr:MAG: hypothetical protein CSA03_01390 [Bacteroidota bacterium]